MNSQGIAGDTKCGRFCLTVGGIAHLWYELIDVLQSQHCALMLG